jgi:hypothetical protein
MQTEQGLAVAPLLATRGASTIFSILQGAPTPQNALANMLSAARERLPVEAELRVVAALRKTFSQVVQSAVDRFSASTYSPPTRNGDTRRTNARGKEADPRFALHSRTTSSYSPRRRESLARHSPPNTGTTWLGRYGDPRSGKRGTEASPPASIHSLMPVARHIHRHHAQARKRDCVQSLPERFPRPLPPWDVSFSGSFFMR